VNGRGQGLINTANELRLAGFGEEAAAIDHIRNEENWSWYAKCVLDVVVRTSADLL
jgi:hypothetical protein